MVEASFKRKSAALAKFGENLAEKAENAG